MRAKKNNSQKITVIVLSGSLTLASIKQHEEKWEQELNKLPKNLAFDFFHVTFIDSTAIGTLVKLFNEAQSRKVKIILFNINPLVQEMFDSIKLEKFFTILSKKDFDALYDKIYKRANAV